MNNTNSPDVVRVVCLAQDYSNSILSYAIQHADEEQLLRSNKTLVSLSNISDTQGRVFSPRAIPDICRFSTDGVDAFLNDKRNTPPHRLYGHVRKYLKRFVFFRDDSPYDLLALYIMATYVFRIFRSFPYLHIIAEKNSGKSTLLDALAQVVFNAELGSQFTGAAIYRTVHRNSSTLLIDEFENQQTHVSQILNSGFSLTGSVRLKKEKFAVYSPKIFGSIQPIDNDILRSRVIGMRMHRKLPNETIERFILDEDLLSEVQQLRDDLYLFGLRYASLVADSYETASSARKLRHLSNRDWDLWAPLFSVALVIDRSEGNRSDKTRGVVEEISKQILADDAASDSENATVKLLRGIRLVVDNVATERQHGRVNFYLRDIVLRRLIAEDIADAMTTTNQLSRLLNQKLEIKSIPTNLSGNTVRLYAVDLDLLEEYEKRYKV